MLVYCRQKGNTHVGTTWQIKSKLNIVDRNGTYKLRVAIASATLAEMQVKILICILLSNIEFLIFFSFYLEGPN